MSKHAGKVAVVTGASLGIGAGIAKTLAAEGASVIVNYVKNKEAAEAVVRSIQDAGGRADAIGADVTEAAEVEALIDGAVAKFGRLDILVNNSGVYEFTPLEAATEESFDRLFRTNVLGVVLATQAAAKRLTNGGGASSTSAPTSRPC